MKKLILLASLLCAQGALAQPSASAGGATGKTLVCTDTFDPHVASTTLSAAIVDSTHFGPLSVRDKYLKGVKLNFNDLTLRPYSETGVQVFRGRDHATMQAATVPAGATFDPSFDVILTLGTDWLNAGLYSVGQLEFYCDECGGGIPTFQPNLFCRVQ